MKLKDEAEAGIDTHDPNVGKFCQRVAELCIEVEHILQRYELMKKLFPSFDWDGNLGGEMSSLKRKMDFDPEA